MDERWVDKPTVARRAPGGGTRPTAARRRPARHAAWVLGTALICAALPIAIYMSMLPGLRRTRLLAFPIIALAPVALWILALVVGVVAFALTFHAGAWWRAALVVVLLAVALPLPLVVDWRAVWLDSQVTLQRGGLDALADRRRDGEELDGARLPGMLALLDTDGRVRQECDVPTASGPQCVLFLQVWEDWRAESGVGLAWFPEPPTADSRVTTAAGDSRGPTRHLGGGWWWMDCGGDVGCGPLARRS